MGVLLFDGVNDQIKFQTITAVLADVTDGAWTMAFLCKFADFSHFNALGYLLAGAPAGVAKAGLSYNSSVTDMFVDVSSGSEFDTPTIDQTSSPYMFAVSKAAGTATPRLAYKLGSGGSWSHADGSANIGDQIDSTQLQIGSWEDGDFFEGHIGLVGAWEGAMSDGNKEALDDGWRTSAWWNSAHGRPLFLAELNVAASSVVDIAGNASNLTGAEPTLDSGETLNDWTFDGAGAGGIANISFRNYPKPLLRTTR